MYVNVTSLVGCSMSILGWLNDRNNVFFHKGG